LSDNRPWHESVLSSGWRDALAILEGAGLTQGFYLAGGTGLALQMGHRTSVDVDLFTRDAFDPLLVRDALRGTPRLRILQLADNRLHAEVAAIPSSFLRYAYPLLFNARRYHGLAVADVRDIACMKVDAVSSRGSRRDFVDLYFILREYRLAELLEWFDRKYESVAPSQVHLAKALTYFDDAELEPMPHMLAAVNWSTVKEHLEREVRTLF
jgi:hypothetical protein